MSALQIDSSLDRAECITLKYNDDLLVDKPESKFQVPYLIRHRQRLDPRRLYLTV